MRVKTIAFAVLMSLIASTLTAVAVVQFWPNENGDDQPVAPASPEMT